MLKERWILAPLFKFFIDFKTILRMRRSISDWWTCPNADIEISRLRFEARPFLGIEIRPFRLLHPLAKDRAGVGEELHLMAMMKNMVQTPGLRKSMAKSQDFWEKNRNYCQGRTYIIIPMIRGWHYQYHSIIIVSPNGSRLFFFDGHRAGDARYLSLKSLG